VSGPSHALLSHLHRLCEPALPDATLLARWRDQRDHAAFALLTARHGPMVLGVCRRILGDVQDAEDAFQATFVVLARKAGKLRRPEALASFLYGAALRIARKARTAKRRRLVPLPSPAPEPVDPRPQPLDVLTGRELLELLDAEIARLPETYRLPLLLCLLQGRTVEDAARQLGWSIGSLRGRLERGREQLRRRLSRRGLGLSVGAVALLAPAVVPEKLLAESARLLSGPVPSAIGVLAGSSISAMKLKIVCLSFFLLAAAGLGVGLSLLPAPVPDKPATPTLAAQPPQAKAAKADEPPAERKRPKIVQVFPADGAVDVEPITKIRIRFDRPMDPTSAMLLWDFRSIWDFRSKIGFRPRGEMRYDEKTHEFILPVQLSPGHTHPLIVNRESFARRKEKDYDGFQSKEHIAAKPYRWSFTTKKLPTKKGNRPRVTSLTPASGSEVSLLTPLEVAFDKPMDASTCAVSFDAPPGSDRLPRLLGRAESDAERRRFTLLLALPANWNGEFRLEGFRGKDGVETEPIAVKYRTQRSIYSEALRKRIEQAGQSDKLQQLVERVRQARRKLRSVSEEVRTADSYRPFSYWYQTFEMQGARFQMQGEQKFLGVIDGIMRNPFRVGSNGTTAWLRRQNERIALPAKEIKEKNVLFCDPFHSTGAEPAKRVIQDMKLEHLGEAVVRGRRCHRVRSWVTELNALDSLSPIREWYIDTQTLLPLRVEMAGMGLQTIDYSYSSVNQPIPDKEFSPDAEPGLKDVKTQPLDKGYTYRFLTIIDGSTGRMSVRWGEKSPKGATRSSGLN
jgi:RNA polymerase sigma factor (sigma-70 family)